jgi:beta-phosphoglucomutase-like phosphatase (HAD superfamily)
MEGVLVDAERYYRAWCDWARLNDIQRPEQYFIDPASDGAKATLQQKAEAAQRQEQAAKQLQSTALALEQMGHAVKKYGIDVGAAVEKYKADSQSDQKEAELTVGLVKDRESAERDLKKPAAPAKVDGTAAAN